MAHPLHHAQNSARKFGGLAEDYLAIHSWFDESKAMMADFRHRALRHHAEGIFMAEKIFGVAIRNSDGKLIPTRYIGEQHVREDIGWIPSIQDWYSQIKPAKWMGNPPVNLEKALEKTSQPIENVETDISRPVNMPGEILVVPI